MPRLIDETNKRYGKLLVLELAEKTYPATHRYWKCQCDCGNTSYVKGSNLRSGESRSCGCSGRGVNNKVFIAEGQRFGRLTITGASSVYKNQWSCLCDCGEYKDIRGADIRSGHTTSCGCYNREVIGLAKTRHGQSVVGKQSTNYKIWFSIKQRCYNPNNKRYNDYGGRGITFYTAWANDFVVFDTYLNETLGPKPKGLTLDRIDNNLGYLPGNLRWATYKEQSNNRRVREDARKKEV